VRSGKWGIGPSRRLGGMRGAPEFLSAYISGPLLKACLVANTYTESLVTRCMSSDSPMRVQDTSNTVIAMSPKAFWPRSLLTETNLPRCCHFRGERAIARLGVM
jgi:predicted membrane-bound mannosyltransferase